MRFRFRVLRTEPARTPFPHVARDRIQTVAIWRERVNRADAPKRFSALTLPELYEVEPICVPCEYMVVNCGCGLRNWRRVVVGVPRALVAETRP